MHAFCLRTLFALASLLGARAIGNVQEHICKRAAIFTPFDMLATEDTRYLVGVVSSLQMIWCERIEILIPESSSCRTIDCISNAGMAKMFDARRIKSGALTIRVISADGAALRPVGEPEGDLANTYDIFVLFGAEKLPAYAGIGTGINFYVCSFPYDLDQMQSEEKISYLTTYDGVFLPSFYSLTHYANFIYPYLLRARNRVLMHPDLLVSLQPVVPLIRQKETHQFKALNNTVSISFYGDFFPGENNNGHDVALSLLQRLSKDFPFVHLKLYMLGVRGTVAGTDEYINALKSTAAQNKLDVEFIINPTFEQKSATIGTSQMLWDMEGVHHPSRSDLGVGAVIDTAVVQAMSAGAIVITQDHGVASEIIKNKKYGFLAETMNDYYSHSVDILHSDFAAWQDIKTAAAARAAAFEPHKVIAKMAAQLKSSILLEPYHQFVAKHLANVKNLKLSPAEPGSTDNIAVILLTGFQTSSEFSIRHAMAKLGPQWQLSVWVNTINSNYYREILGDIPNIQFNYLPKHLVGVEVAEDALLKSVSFWESLPAKKALIFGANTLIANPDIEPFMKYDFIGAPFETVSKNSKSMLLSGGCSLRSIEVMRQLIELNPKGITPQTQEYHFFWWATHLESTKKVFPGIMLPDAQTASDFAVGAGYPGMHHYHTPVCLDNPWEHMDMHKDVNIGHWMQQAVDELNI